MWTDYICPWAYAARPHTEWLRANGATVVIRAYELHPDLPLDGRPIRPGGRLDHVLDHIAEVCAEHGQPFVKPTRTPNSRRSLVLFEIVAADDRVEAAALDRDLAAAHWVDGLAIDDPAVLDDLLRRRLGSTRSAQVREQFAVGEGAELLAESRELAHDVGATATPAWRIGELTITGLHAPEQFQRWAGRLLNVL